jgi:hypothetical protein
MAARLKGKVARIGISARVEPSDKAMLKKTFGSIQAAIDWLVINTKCVNLKTKRMNYESNKE